MLLKALDLLRTLGWGIISFIYSLIDSLLEIINKMNTFNIIDTLAQNTIFENLHSGVIVIALTLFGLFVVWSFVKKVMDPDEGMSISQIYKEVLKCGCYIILSTFLFSQIASFSIQLSGFTSSIFKNNDTKLSYNMLELYVDYSEGYKLSDNPQIDYDTLSTDIENKNFTNSKQYNDKYVTNEKFILQMKRIIFIK